MTTKLEINEALVSQIEAAARTRGVPVQEFMRYVLERAVSPAEGPIKRARFEQRVHDFGTHIESPWTILADIESEEHIRKYGRK